MRSQSIFFVRAMLPALLALALLSTTSVAAQKEELPPLVFDAQIGGQTTALALDGTRLYLGIGTRMDVFDVTQPNRPTLVGTSAPLPQPVSSITPSNGYAYVSDGSGGLHILDVHDSTQPTEITHIDLGGSVVRVSIDGATAYVAASESGLHVLDVSDPSTPREIGEYNANFGVLDVAIVAPLAYAAVDDGAMNRGVRIAQPRIRALDISDPTKPVELGVADVAGGAFVSNHLMVADATHVYEYWNLFGASGCDTGGIHVLDVSDPTAPTRTSDLPGACFGDAIAGTATMFAVASGNSDSIWLYQPAAATPAIEIHPGMPVTGMALANSLLYITGTDQSTGQASVRILNLSDPGHPSTLGSYAEAALTHAQGVTVGQRAFFADRGRLSIVDLTQPAQPRELGNAILPATNANLANWSNDLVVIGSDAYVMDGKTLLTYNVSNVAQPALISQQDLGVGMFGLAQAGGYLYAIDAVEPPPPSFGLQYQLIVLDLRDPGHPSPVGEFAGIGGLWHGMTISSAHLYLTANGALNVLDLSDPVHPRLVGSAPFADIGGDRLAVIGNRVYVGGFQGVHPYDVSDPAAPQALAPFGGEAGLVSSVTTDGLRLYAAYWASGGVRVWDVSDPSNPMLIGAYPNIPNGSVAASVFAFDDHVMTSTYSGLWVLHL